MDLCLAGYLTHSSLMAFTTTILNSSPISAIKDEICFIKRSIELSLPVRGRGRVRDVNMCIGSYESTDRKRGGGGGEEENNRWRWW